MRPRVKSYRAEISTATRPPGMNVAVPSDFTRNVSQIMYVAVQLNAEINPGKHSMTFRLTVSHWIYSLLPPP